MPLSIPIAEPGTVRTRLPSPDEDLAGELERSAERARARGGVAAAAAFVARATELTSDPVRRGTRALAAAQAKFDAAAPDSAFELIATAAIAPLDELQRARLDRLRAQITFARTRGNDAPALLLDAATRLEPLDVRLARETYLEALRALIFVGRLSGARTMQDTAEAARAARPGPRPPRAIDLLLDGLATRFTDGYAAAWPHSGERSMRSGKRTGPARTTGDGSGWPARWRPSPSHPTSGTTSRGID